MEYYAVQVWTGKEDDFAHRIATDPAMNSKTLVPKKAMQVRRAGKIRREERPLFPGYVFIATEASELEIFRQGLAHHDRPQASQRKGPEAPSPFHVVRESCRYIEGKLRRRPENSRARRSAQGTRRPDSQGGHAQAPGKGTPGHVRELVPRRHGLRNSRSIGERTC